MSPPDRPLSFSLPLWWTTVLPFVALLLVPLSVSSNDDDNASQQAMSIIDRMSKATRTLNFDGYFVYRRGNSLDGMRIIHKTENGRELERLISLTGPAREVIRNDKTTTCIFSDNRAVTVSKHRSREFFPASLPTPIGKVSDLYTFSVLEKEPVAGRPSWRVHITPKDSDRYGYQLWIDTESYLLMRSNVIGPTGEILEQILFTNIELHDQIPDALLQPAVNGHGFQLYTNESQVSEPLQSTDSEWHIGWLPGGFVMRDYEVQSMPPSPMPVDHMVFSDGLSTISVFVEKLEEDNKGLQGHTSLGAISTYSIVANSHQVTVVGELPAPTLKQIAGSVSRLPLASK